MRKSLLKKCFIFTMIVTLFCPQIPVAAQGLLTSPAPKSSGIISNVPTMPYYNGIEYFELDIKNALDWTYMTKDYYSAFYKYNEIIDDKKLFFSMISSRNTEVPVPLIGKDTLFSIKFPDAWFLSETDFGEIYVYGAYFSKDETGKLIFTQDELAHYVRHPEPDKKYTGSVDDFFSKTKPINLYDFVADKPIYSSIVIKALQDTYGWANGDYGISANVIGVLADRFTDEMLTVAPTFPLTDLQLSQTEISLDERKTTSLNAVLTPYYTTDKNISWSSDNTAVATVDSNGKVTAVAAGTATISASVGDMTASCIITVTKNNVTFNANGGKFDSKKKTLTIKREDLKNTLSQITAPARSKYAFSGWYTKATGGTKITTKNYTTVGKNATLYAHWSKITVTGTKITSLKNSATKAATIKFNKVTKADGYEIQYSTDKTFKSKKTVTIAAVSKKVTSLKVGKTYYFRVRAYRLDSTGSKIYSPYSTVKSVKITK